MEQAGSRFRIHGSKLNAHSLARLGIAHYRRSPDLATRNLKIYPDDLADGGRILHIHKEASQS